MKCSCFCHALVKKTERKAESENETAYHHETIGHVIYQEHYGHNAKSFHHCWT
jgi:hypothetical protein